MEAKRKRTKNIIIAAVLVAVAILMAALPAMLSSGQKEENTGTAKSVAVQRGDIDSTVAGAGTLSGGDGVKITVPHGVEITEYLVANGDVVAEGQALAAVDKTSVMNTIATVQNNLEYLAGQVRTAASGATNAYLAAPAAGRVKAIYADAISAEEEADFRWLQEHAPDLSLYATVEVKLRVLPRRTERPMLAIGQKAAYFTGTRHFVNIVEGGGMYGFDGICRLCARIEEAFLTARDPRNYIQQKGLGCESCL